MIKKVLLWLWLCVLWFLGFSNWVWVFSTVWLNSFSSPLDSNYSITALKWGGLLTNYLWVWKSVLALDNQRLFRWTTNWYPYVYLHNNWTFWIATSEWFFDRYYSCDYMTWAWVPQNCSYSMIDYSWWTSDFDKTVFKSFFSTVTQWENIYIESQLYRYVGATRTYNQNYIRVCRNSTELNKSFCFMGWVCTSNNCPYLWSLVNSQNLHSQFTNWLTFWLLNTSWIWYAPWQNWYDWQFEWSTDWSVDWTIDSSITWDYVYYDCTWKDILIALESEWYNKYICYWWLDNFEDYDPSINYTPVAWRWLSIAQIWAWTWSRAWDTFPEWFTFWNGLYNDSNDYTDMWSSYPAVYRTYFQIYNAYKWSILDPRTVLEYCQLRTLTWDTLNNTAWWYFRPVCETVVREKQTWLWDCRTDWTLYSWCELNPQVAIWTNWNWVWNLSWLTTKSDWVTFIQEFFNLAKSKLSTSFGVNYVWIIPNYIIVFLMGIVLFRFLSRH